MISSLASLGQSLSDFSPTVFLEKAFANLSRELNRPQNSSYASHPLRDRAVPPTSENTSEVIALDAYGKSLASSPTLSRVRAGTFTINKVAIALNPVVDSFQEIVGRINGSGAGVNARYDVASNRLVLTSENGKKIEVTNDNTNFLEEANLSLGTYLGSTVRPDYANPGNATQGSHVSAAVSAFASSFNLLLQEAQISTELKEKLTLQVLDFVRSNSQSSSLGDATRLQTGGIVFSKDGDFLFRSKLFLEELQKNPSDFVEFFSGEKGFGHKVLENALQLIQEAQMTGKNVNQVV